jgi:hypothetical protein
VSPPLWAKFSMRSEKLIVFIFASWPHHRAISNVYAGLDLSCETFPDDSVADPAAYLKAFDSFRPGDAVTIFTPVGLYLSKFCLLQFIGL